MVLFVVGLLFRPAELFHFSAWYGRDRKLIPLIFLYVRLLKHLLASFKDLPLQSLKLFWGKILSHDWYLVLQYSLAHHVQVCCFGLMQSCTGQVLWRFMHFQYGPACQTGLWPNQCMTSVWSHHLACFFPHLTHIHLLEHLLEHNAMGREFSVRIFANIYCVLD